MDMTPDHFMETPHAMRGGGFTSRGTLMGQISPFAMQGMEGIPRFYQKKTAKKERKRFEPTKSRIQRLKEAKELLKTVKKLGLRTKVAKKKAVKKGAK